MGDLKEDLALIAAAQLELAPAGGSGATIVSAVETIPAAPPRTTPAPARRRAPKTPPPQDVAVAANADESDTALEMVTVSPADAPVAAEEPAPELAPAVRPRPIDLPYPVGGGTVFGPGRDEGTGIGGVVIRGGRTGRDPCVIHDRRGRPGVGVMINDRVRGRPTFPRY